MVQPMDFKNKHSNEFQLLHHVISMPLYYITFWYITSLQEQGSIVYAYSYDFYWKRSVVYACRSVQIYSPKLNHFSSKLCILTIIQITHSLLLVSLLINVIIAFNSVYTVPIQ